jgi:hypothetical protein
MRRSKDESVKETGEVGPVSLYDFLSGTAMENIVEKKRIQRNRLTSFVFIWFVEY